MKTKLTLTIEKSLIPAVKRIAKIEGSSVSQVVENKLTEYVKSKKGSFASKWKGQFKAANKKGDPKYEYLAKKYL